MPCMDGSNSVAWIGGMKRTPLARKTPLKRGAGPKPKRPMKRSQPRRDWTAARAKVEAEGNRCRICGQGPAEAAHVIGREHDQLKPCHRCKGTGLDPHIAYADADGVDNIEAPCRFCGYGGGEYVEAKSHTLWVNPAHVIPLCRQHHAAYDAHTLEILPVLTLDEQVEAVRCVGSIESARQRTAPGEGR